MALISGGGGGGSQTALAFCGITTSGPPSGVDGFLPLIPMASGLGSGVPGCAVGYFSYGVPVTIGAGGGFAILIMAAQAYMAAHPGVTAYAEINVSNAAGTQKLLLGLTGAASFHNFSTWSEPNWAGAVFSTYEAAGADLSYSANAFGGGYPGVVSAAGGQLFANLFVQLFDVP